jgi:hypothetical protein
MESSLAAGAPLVALSASAVWAYGLILLPPAWLPNGVCPKGAAADCEPEIQKE